ncbi:MAG: metalloregulator ArsR/SmtB family transcription factor [Acidobacteria bacterium]|nr:metalloregulator ArsR/SmtB family transcription factor [Acidobacteriota bacterium]
MSVLADPIRCRLLLALESHELAVSELCSVLQLPQSTVSRHLKVLGDGGWVSAYRDGTSRRYAAHRGAWEDDARRLWSLVREQVAPAPAAAEDQRRLERVLAERRTKSQEFFSSAAGQWAQMRLELFGRRFDLHALLALLDPSWTVGDLGCGTGQLAEALAPFVRQLIAVDDSDAMLDAAARRLAPLANVELRRGSIEALPIDDESLDVALLVLVLHHLPEPGRCLEAAARTLKPGGRLLVVDMLPHDHEEYRQQMGHVWLGFGEAQLAAWLEATGLEGLRFHPLPADADARGPGLFTAVARRSGAAT